MYKIVIILLIIGIIPLSSCNSWNKKLNPVSGKGGAERIDVSASSNITQAEIQIMVREFLNKIDGENPFYRHYSYLVFTENNSTNYDKRIAASKAFICEFSDSSKGIKMGLTANELAVFYAPINPNENIEELLINNSPEEFLNAYNYDFARAIVNKINSTNPIADISIAIISYPLPLGLKNGNINNLSIDALNIINLSNTPPPQIRKVIEKFRRSVTSNYKVKEVQVITKVDPNNGTILDSKMMKVPVLEENTNIEWANKMRKVFASLGALIGALSPTAHASTLSCS